MALYVIRLLTEELEPMPIANIAIAGFQHETNTFSPDLATYMEFMKEDSWPGLTEKSDIGTKLKGMNLPMAGFIDAASINKNIQLHPIVWASAEPCGYVTQDAFDKIAKKICAGIADIKSLDGIYLDLHGAMVAHNFQDGESELLRRIRQLVGPNLPIVVSLDLHANISPSMVELSSAIAIFRTYPHLDMADTGARAYDLLQHILVGKPLQKAMHQLPFLVPLTSQCTDLEPCRSIYQTVGQLNSNDESLMSLDFALGFPAADTYDCGPCLVAYGTDQKTTDAAINTMVSIVLGQETALSQPLYSADAAAKKAIKTTLNNSQLVVIADAQDNPGAGATSNTTGVLRALLNNKATQAYVAVLNDVQVTTKAHQLGLGARFRAELGGHSGVCGDKPLPCELEVCELANGDFEFTGEMYHGITAHVGAMALLKVIEEGSDVYVITSINRVQCLDLAIIRHLNVDPQRASVIAVKSSVHFRADFTPIADEILVVASPGHHPCELESVIYKNLREGMRRC